MAWGVPGAGWGVGRMAMSRWGGGEREGGISGFHVAESGPQRRDNLEGNFVPMIQCFNYPKMNTFPKIHQNQKSSLLGVCF